MKTFSMAKGLDLPRDAATQVAAFMGRRGSGKTYGAGRLIEELLYAEDQVVILDPVGVWHGLRLAADGKAPGFKIPIFGGIHGDIPLSATAGKVVADLVATRALSVVLDVSEFTGADQRRFVAEFCTELFHAKKRHRSAVMVVFEEAQEFAPQHVSGETAKMVGAVERLIKLGRNFGVGACLISQRPQAVNKDVLNLTEVMFAFQLTGPQERKTIAGWVQEKGAGSREIADELPGLPVGEAMVWSPQWLRSFGRYKILPKRTFDASATPTGGHQSTPMLAPVDLDEVLAAMLASTEEIKANDPKELRAEISRLRTELSGRQPKVERVEVRVEVPTVPEGLLGDVEVLIGTARAGLNAIENVIDDLTAARDRIRGIGVQEGARPLTLRERLRAETPTPEEEEELRALATGDGNSPVADWKPAPAPRPRATKDGGVSGPAIEAIRQLAAAEPRGLTRRQLATLCGYAVNKSTLRNLLSELRTHGMIGEEGETIRPTAAALGKVDGVVAKRSARELLEMWGRKIGGRELEILTWFAQNRGPFTYADISKHFGIPQGVSTLRNYMSTLTTNDLVARSKKGFVVNPGLAL